ncbi:PREDICTED: uncharacterized protein At5g19025-like isoform X1 [Lupinus angustifolius]|uniref:uncharacterized protein At5g19025-like isoform X1 n=1 Tax=Lupinus angustifolius TaxID=3871 RepID=UPI00092F8DF4|nr:PREDICTED: uncharacterized protein At5g19025-like isoform X1 [Lupinus angustifolius]
MHHHFIFTTLATTMPSSSATPSPPPSSNPKHKSSSHSHLCNHHSPSATLDLLILLLVLFSATFLLSSYFSYIFSSLSLLSQSHSSFSFPLPSSSYLLGFLLFFLSSFTAVACCSSRSRKCGKRGCRGLKKSMEFDLQIQTEESFRIGSRSGFGEIDKLPWKGGSEGNPDYECLRAELRKMAPPNGRAVLLFRSPCGCPIAKLEGWGSKKGKRQKRSTPNVSLNGRGDHH